MGGVRRRGDGYMSRFQTEEHIYPGWGLWFKSEEERRSYIYTMNLKKRARLAHWQGELEAFAELEQQMAQARKDTKKQEAWVKSELVRLKKKHGLGKQANRQHLAQIAKATGDPEVMDLLNVMGSSSMNDRQRVAHIRLLYLRHTPPSELLYQVALIVGVNIRKRA